LTVAATTAPSFFTTTAALLKTVGWFLPTTSSMANWKLFEAGAEVTSRALRDGSRSPAPLSARLLSVATGPRLSGPMLNWSMTLPVTE
jgi:hypothetical protein